MKLEQRTDRELIRLYVAGDEAGLEILIDRYKAKLYTSIYLLVKDETLAEDLFQDTFIKVIHTLRSGRYNEEGKFLPWVMRIAHNLVIDYYRKERRTPVVVNSEGFDIFDVLQFSDESAEARMIRAQTYSDLRQPRHQYAVLVMRLYGDSGFKEMARVTEVSIHAALGRMRYALQNLREMMCGGEGAGRVG